MLSCQIYKTWWAQYFCQKKPLCWLIKMLVINRLIGVQHKICTKYWSTNPQYTHICTHTSDTLPLNWKLCQPYIKQKCLKITTPWIIISLYMRRGKIFVENFLHSLLDYTRNVQKQAYTCFKVRFTSKYI